MCFIVSVPVTLVHISLRVDCLCPRGESGLCVCRAFVLVCVCGGVVCLCLCNFALVHSLSVLLPERCLHRSLDLLNGLLCRRMPVYTL